MSRIDPDEARALFYDWPVWARVDQLPKPNAQVGSNWTVWLMLGGRGSGKTRAGAEWVRGLVSGLPIFTDKPVRRIALVGETFADVRDVMIEGESGLLAVHPPDETPKWISSRRRLEWPNGAVAQVFSAEEADSLRGPQFEAAWVDELAKWKDAESAWSMLQFCLRLGTRPRQAVTTTPRPIKLIKSLLDDAQTLISRSATKDNKENLAPDFLQRIVGQYEGTRLGRQELHGDVLEERQDALWKRVTLERCRIRDLPQLGRIVIAVDPPTTSHEHSDACGMIVAGLQKSGGVCVLEDVTLTKATPLEWASHAARVFNRYNADCIVAEVNQGGDMVETILRQVDANLPIRKVHATRGKWTRAEPVAALYEQGQVSHLGALEELEDEMCSFGEGKLPSGKSPDRVDALVWAIHDLLLQKTGEPKVRSLNPN